MRTAETPKSRHNAYKEVQTLHSELIDHNLGTIQAFLIQLTQGTDALTSAQRILVEKAAETYTPFIEKRAAAIECIAARRVPPLTIRTLVVIILIRSY